jgi:hypothetical protein
MNDGFMPHGMCYFVAPRRANSVRAEIAALN